MNNKKGQVTIFIIIALVIVVFGVLIYMFLPKLKITSEFDVNNPEAYISSCIKDDLEDAVDLLSKQGGSLEPVFYHNFEGEKVQYLCYTDQIFESCYRQYSNLRATVEEEIDNFIEEKAKSCFYSLREKYETKNYQATLKEGEVDTNLISERITFDFNYELSTMKGQNSETYKNFEFVLNTKLYELLRLVDSIVEWEMKSPTGAPIFDYLVTYPELSLDKNAQENGVFVYVLSYDKTNDKFQFASRSKLTSSSQI